ncbi:uncharacterized protein LOC113315739 [Papaver somniferum]|uniref:uncharacterized protein LOC113315739 n=1 Tax=Papaver somniferum TaxID=3469 RepID=UPI000E705FE2|nr:uncharacterized protein LOC113315739 [Papaver somniferum]
MNVNIATVESQNIDVSDWISSWFHQSSDCHKHEWNNWVITLMTTAWFIWKNRCSKVFENKNQNIFFTISSINFMINHCITAAPVRIQKQVQLWSPPPMGVLKINVDAAFVYDTSEFDIGLIIRDSTGICRGIRGKYFNGGIDPENVECLHIKEALMWARDCQFHQVILEGISLNVINSINQKNSSVQWNNLGIIEDIRQIVSTISCFSGITLSHVKRTANNVAHVIAKTSIADRSTFEYSCNIPDKFKKIIGDDQKSISLSYVN